MTVTLTPKDIIDSSKHFNGDIFDIVIEDMVDNSAKKKAIYDTTWIPIVFKKIIIDSKGGISIKKMQIKKLCFEMVLTASRAMTPPQDEGAKPKNMLLMFKKMTLDEIRSGDYVPKQRNTEEETAREIKQIEEYTEELFNKTSEFVDALDAIAEGHDKLCERIKETYISNPNIYTFNMGKEPSWIKRDKKGAIIGYEPIIRSIKQSNRKDSKNKNNLIPIDVPLFRLKLPVNVNNGKLQLTWKNNNSNVEEVKPYVYDARKTIIDVRNNVTTLVTAKYKTNGRLHDIDIDNAAEFITYKSIVSGHIEFPKLVISKQGFTIVNSIKQLVVKRHRSKTSSDINLTQSSLIKMKGNGSDSEDNADETTEDVLAKTNAVAPKDDKEPATKKKDVQLENTKSEKIKSNGKHKLASESESESSSDSDASEDENVNLD